MDSCFLRFVCRPWYVVRSPYFSVSAFCKFPKLADELSGSAAKVSDPNGRFAAVAVAEANGNNTVPESGIMP